MLSEVTTHLVHIVDGWIAWTSKGGEGYIKLITLT